MRGLSRGDAVGQVTTSVAGLGDQEFEYELRLTRLVSAADPEFARALREKLDGGAGDTDDLYACFYAAHVYYRRLKETSELGELMQRHGDRFRGRPTYPHLRALYCATAGRDEEAFRCADAARGRAPEHAGILHHYAVLTLDRQEAADEPSPDALQTAEQALDAALAATGGIYGRHHATYARVHILRGDFVAADEAVDRAIDLEEPGADYPIRIGEYQAIKLSARVARSSSELRKQQSKTIAELEGVRRSIDARLGEARTEAIQLLGLLAAVIAFIVGSTSIAAQLEDFDTSGRLLVLFTGAILVVYAGFGTAFGRPGWRHLLVFAFGLAVGALALFGWRFV